MKLSKIINAGINEHTPKNVAKKIVLSNGLALIIAFGVAGPFFVISLIHFGALAYLPLAGVVLCLFTIVLNGLGLQYLGRFILGLIPFTLTALYGAYLTPADQLPLPSIFTIQVAFAVIPFILFEISEKAYLIVSGAFILITITFFSKDLNQLLEMDLDIEVATNGYVYYLAIATGVLVASGSILFMSYSNHKTNKEQEDLVALMDKRNEELQKSEDTLRENLKKVEENQLEETRRNWASKGLAKFGNLLRSNEDNDVLFDQLISGITQYIDANQSALFIVDKTNKDDVKIELKACYAYSRKKFVEKSIAPGEGLLGQVYYEQEILYLKEVPQGYTNITSGLGDASPNAIIIVPLIANEEIEGFFEIASFKEFEPHQVEFLKDLAENVASFVGVNRINVQTKLLLEETQQQAEEMKSQEEEMRQNMEELQATHEEMNRKEQEYIARLEKLEAELAQARSSMKDVLSTN
ncbi:MAG: GAF domain-containing protein [Cytophagales bacterium]|nr:GAF domain-containing protein [Cytophagales bacterium]